MKIVNIFLRMESVLGVYGMDKGASIRKRYLETLISDFDWMIIYCDDGEYAALYRR